MNSIIKQQYQAHPYHLVTNSPWPIAVSFSLMSFMSLTALTMHNYINNKFWMFISLITLIGAVALWLRDIIIEGSYLGDHTMAVRKGLNIGFILFILSEALVFLGVFWAYFHSAMSPTIELGSSWPPVGIEAIGPTELPLLNTILLLSSGATLTWSHHALIKSDRNQTLIALLITIVLAILFLICQYIEYQTASFTISDGVYGTVFFAGTGLHGLHVLVGALMLIISFFRIYSYQLTNLHNLGYETSILYWHFVDVVWIFLFIVYYWWGS